MKAAAMSAAAPLMLVLPIVNMENVEKHDQQEQELMLQTFRDVSKIYHILQNRHMNRPTFLHRTLGYMKDRMSRNNKSRGSFKLNCLLEHVAQNVKYKSNKCINIDFSNFIADSSRWNIENSVFMECILYEYKLMENKRQKVQIIKTFTLNVPCNSDESNEQKTGISIPLRLLRPGCETNNIYKLLFRTRLNPKRILFTENNMQIAVTRRKIREISSVRIIYGCEITILQKNSDILRIPDGCFVMDLQELRSLRIKPLSATKHSGATLPVLKFQATLNVNEETVLAETRVSNNKKYIKTRNSPTEKVRLEYIFVCSKNRCQTEVMEEMICIWCGLKCFQLYSLMNHLKLCHPRMSFCHQPTENGASIVVTVKGSNRLYYADNTLTPIRHEELKFHSEESVPSQVQKVTNRMVNGFTGLNEGEREFFKLWFLHITEQNFISSSMLPLACEMFLDINGINIVRNNLSNNFILHMALLKGRGYISEITFNKNIQKLQQILRDCKDAHDIISKQREAEEIACHNEKPTTSANNKVPTRELPAINFQTIGRKKANPRRRRTLMPAMKRVDSKIGPIQSDEDTETLLDKVTKQRESNEIACDNEIPTTSAKNKVSTRELPANNFQTLGQKPNLRRRTVMHAVKRVESQNGPIQSDENIGSGSRKRFLRRTVH